MSQCANCTTMAQMIQRQQAEIAMLKQIIAEASGECTQLEREAGQVMSLPGSPYRYNIYKGRRDAAELVRKRLKGKR